MTISLHSASAPVFIHMLTALDHVLAMASDDAARRRIDPSVFLTARLAPDMFPLTRQVQIATDHAKGAMARLSGRDNPKFEDSETTFAELAARIAATLDFVRSVPAEEIDGQEERPVTVKLPTRTLDFVGEDYLLHFAMPNFYFHVTAAYAVLRHLGVPVGKGDYLWRG